jgi:hypothetical protein
MIITKEQVEQAFNVGGFTMNERYLETGFIYFPSKELSGQEGRDYPDQGRVFWNVEKHVYPDTLVGRADKQIDASLGSCRDTFSTSVSHGRPNDRQLVQIESLIKLYVLFRRQQKPDYVFSVADRAVIEEEVEV